MLASEALSEVIDNAFTMLIGELLNNDHQKNHSYKMFCR